MGIKQLQLLQEQGLQINFTRQELLTSLILFNIGALGQPQSPLYLASGNKYQIDRGNFYEYSNDVKFMRGMDRTFFMLQKFEIKLSYNEYLGIRLAYGPYDESSDSYFNMQQQSLQNKNTMFYIVYTANMLSSVIWSSKDMKKYEKMRAEVF